MPLPPLLPAQSLHSTRSGLGEGSAGGRRLGSVEKPPPRQQTRSCRERGRGLARGGKRQQLRFQEPDGRSGELGLPSPPMREVW